MAASTNHLLRLFDSGADFHLGHLPTEGFHPATAGLDGLAARDTAGALRALFQVDEDVVERIATLPEEARVRAATKAVIDRLQSGGRAIVVGCGATGRLALLIEKLWREACRRVSLPELADRVVGIIAGGDYALVRSVEYFEDHQALAALQLEPLGVSARDAVVAVTEGGETPFVLGAARHGLTAGAAVTLLYSNPDEALVSVERSASLIADPRTLALSVATGPMAISGSTRMQATTVELVLLAGIFEHALRHMAGREPGGAWRQLIEGVAAAHRSASGEEVVAPLATAVQLEEQAYRRGRFANYAALGFALDVLTDTTERTPTFGTPAFRKSGDADADEPWAALVTPYRDGPSAWESLLGRPPACVEWDLATLPARLGNDLAGAIAPLLPGITASELARFAIGPESGADRIAEGGHLVAVAGADDAEAEVAGFLGAGLRKARAVDASTALIVCGTDAAVVHVRTRLPEDAVDVLVPVIVPDDDLMLDSVTHIALKLTLNALSTCTMARMRRVIGNCMACVTPTNGKLIDRSTRYIAELAGLSYEGARSELRAAFLHVAPRMATGSAYPPLVPLVVTSVRRGLTLDEAEAALEYGRPHPAQAGIRPG